MPVSLVDPAEIRRQLGRVETHLRAAVQQAEYYHGAAREAETNAAAHVERQVQPHDRGTADWVQAAVRARQDFVYRDSMGDAQYYTARAAETSAYAQTLIAYAQYLHTPPFDGGPA